MFLIYSFVDSLFKSHNSLNILTITRTEPPVGAVTTMPIRAMFGLQTFDNRRLVLAAAAILLIVVAIGAQVGTPRVLGRGLLLNPVAIFISMLLWGWLWVVVGVLLAVALLASFKIVCERFEPLHRIAAFLTL